MKDLDKFFVELDPSSQDTSHPEKQFDQSILKKEQNDKNAPSFLMSLERRNYFSARKHL